MDPKIDLKTILDLHAKWLQRETGGTRADLYGADLSGADLYRANLSRANLYEADLSGANLYEADLKDTKEADLALAMSTHLPEGPFIGWKKCMGDVIVKLRIPEKAKRSHGCERKCRAEFVTVLEVIGADKGVSIYDKKTEYHPGKTVKANGWDENRWNTCGQGIHFFISRLEAEAFSM
jgi:hypothetical protein